MNVFTPPLIAVSIKAARIRNVVEVVAQRIADQLRHDDLGGEMGDRVNRMLLDQSGDQVRVARVADDELCAFGHGPGEAGGEVVENHDRFARIQQRQGHVAADIAGAAGDQNAHALPPISRLCGVNWSAGWNGGAGT